MYPVSSEGLNKETKKAVYFYTPSFDALNNFSAHRIEIWDVRFPTAEHAYQWKKFYYPPEESEEDSAVADNQPRTNGGRERVRIGHPSAGEARAHLTVGAGVREIRNAIAKQILEVGSPEEAQQIAHKHKLLMPKDWHKRKVAVMEAILRAKLAKHETVRDALKRSGNRTIIENSPTDGFWGCGKDGNGKNMMGALWMKLRGYSKKNATHARISE